MRRAGRASEERSGTSASCGSEKIPQNRKSAETTVRYCQHMYMYMLYCMRAGAKTLNRSYGENNIFENIFLPRESVWVCTKSQVARRRAKTGRTVN